MPIFDAGYPHKTSAVSADTILISDSAAADAIKGINAGELLASGLPISVDTISEKTSANGVTIDGLNIKDSKLNTNNAVVTSNITNDAVTATKIDWASTGADAGIWWEELGRTTLGSAGDTITVSSFPARKYLQIHINLVGTGGTISAGAQFNGDGGSNYSRRESNNGGADTTATSQTSMVLTGASTYINYCHILNFINVSSLEKLGTGFRFETGTAGAGTAPGKQESTHKWANTSSQITSITVTNTGTGDYAIGSEVVVLGHN